jgi:radical SAM superfamily enzyme with C-terminal helix-hairpin-helix motif
VDQNHGLTPILTMKFGPFKVLLAGTAWRTFGSNDAGQTLLDAMSGGDEQERMLAGMSLVKAGARSIGLIQEAIASNHASAAIIRLLADLGGPEARSILKEVATGEPGELKDAAEQSLDLLNRIEALPSDDST